jgi:hypothetical protein
MASLKAQDPGDAKKKGWLGRVEIGSPTVSPPYWDIAPQAITAVLMQAAEYSKNLSHNQSLKTSQHQCVLVQ